MDGARTRINWFWRPATFRLAHHCMVRAEGIEPSTFRLWADYSNHWVIPANSHRESGSGKDLPRYRKLLPLILVAWSHKHSYSHLTYWDWFWPLQAGTQLFAYIVPIYCTTFQCFTGLSCNSDSVYLFRHTTTLTMRGDYLRYFTHHIGTSLTGLCKKFSLQKFCFFVFSLASINNQITTSNVKAKIIST